MTETLTYRVPGMNCAHCESTVKAGLSTVPGVDEVAVDLESKRVTVIGSDLEDSALRSAIDDAGFGVEDA